MAGVLVCHGSATVRDRIVAAAHGVPSLVPARAAASADELVTLARAAAPSLVLLDAHLPGPGPIEALRRLRMLGVHSVVIMLAGPGDELTLDRALAMGARGYLAADVDRSELAAVAAHSLSSAVIPQQPGPRSDPRGGAGSSGRTGSPGAKGQGPDVSGPADETTSANGAGPTKPATPAVELTKRELEVLAGMSNGRSNAQIGAELFLSEDTVKTHARRLFRKLGAADRAQAVAIGLRQGLIR